MVTGGHNSSFIRSIFFHAKRSRCERRRSARCHSRTGWKSARGFDAAPPVHPFAAFGQGSTLEVTHDAAVSGTHHSAHCIGQRSRTVLWERLRSVSGPALGAGYRRRRVYGARARRWLETALRPAGRAPNQRAPRGLGVRRENCVAAASCAFGVPRRAGPRRLWWTGWERP